MIGQVLRGGYKILDEVGRGGFGIVYLARQQSSGAYYAIKALNLSVTDSAESNRVRELFDREQKILSWLSHPAIVQRRDILSESSQVFLVMEYVDGEDLRRILSRQTRGFSPRGVASLALQVCEILAYLHSQKPSPIVFRDLKPSNLMLTREGQIKLVDFGIARLGGLAQTTPNEGASSQPNESQLLFVEKTVALPSRTSMSTQTTELLDSPGSSGSVMKSVSQDTTCMGTPGYAAPEQYPGSGQSSDARCDIYALGAIMFNLLTREEPSNVALPIPPLRSYVVVDQTLEALLERATAINREQRFQTARALSAALEAYLTRTRNSPGIEEFTALLGRSRLPQSIPKTVPSPAITAPPKVDLPKEIPLPILGRRTFLMMGGALTISAVAVTVYGVNHFSTPPFPYSAIERLDVSYHHTQASFTHQGEIEIFRDRSLVLKGHTASTSFYQIINCFQQICVELDSQVIAVPAGEGVSVKATASDQWTSVDLPHNDERLKPLLALCTRMCIRGGVNPRGLF